MRESKGSTTFPAQKTIRANMVKRVRRLEAASAKTKGKRKPQVSVVDQNTRTSKMSPIVVNKVPRGKVRNKRTGPLGKMARISDGAVDSIAEDMEKRTRQAIAVIGRSRGF